MNDVENGNRQAGSGSGNAPFIKGANVTTSNSFTITAGASNITEVAIAILDGASTPLAVAEPQPFKVWLSDAATGVALTSTSASGTVQAKSASGADFGVLTAKKAIIVQPLATGIYTLEITDSAKTGFYICIQSPYSGQVSVSRQLVTGDYGA